MHEDEQIGDDDPPFTLESLSYILGTVLLIGAGGLVIGFLVWLFFFSGLFR